MQSHGGDAVSFRSVARGKYFCIEGNNEPVCNRDQVGDWEKLHVVNNGIHNKH